MYWPWYKINKSSKKKLKINKTKTLGTIILVSGVCLIVIGFVAPLVNSIEIELPKISINTSPTLVPEVQPILEESAGDPIQVDNSLLDSKSDQKSIPQRVIVPELGIDILLSPAKVVNGRWEVFEDKGSFGLGSASPEESGNSVIFAHARVGLFLPLKKAKPGMKVYVLTQDRWFSYEMEKITEVLPSDISVISSTDEPVLTLYTCTGFSDSKRLIVSSKRV